MVVNNAGTASWINILSWDEFQQCELIQFVFNLVALCILKSFALGYMWYIARLYFQLLVFFLFVCLVLKGAKRDEPTYRVTIYYFWEIELGGQIMPTVHLKNVYFKESSMVLLPCLKSLFWTKWSMSRWCLHSTMEKNRHSKKDGNKAI